MVIIIKSGLTRDESSLKLSKSEGERVANFKFKQFDPTNEQWKHYINTFNLEVTLLHSELPNEIKRNLLSRSVGAATYRLIADHFDPALKHSSYFSRYLQARLKFVQCTRKPEHSVVQFFAEIRSGTRLKIW